MATELVKTWLRDGNLIYMLEGTGQFRKGEETVQNYLTIDVRACGQSKTSGQTERDELTDRIHTFLSGDNHRALLEEVERHMCDLYKVIAPMANYAGREGTQNRMADNDETIQRVRKVLGK